MKRASPLLFISIALNVALLAVLLVRPSLAPAGVRRMFGVAEPEPAVRGSVVASRTAIAAPPAEQLWARLRADDPRELILRLRAAGFPSTVLRWMIQLAAEERFGPRLRELGEPDPNTPFWKIPGYHAAGADAERHLELGRVQRERRMLVQALAREAGLADDEESTAEQRRRFGDVPRAKCEAAEAAIADYNDMMNVLRRGQRGVNLPGDTETFALLRRELEADLAAILSPAEREAFELRSSDAAERVRARIVLFDASEAEYRALLAIEREFEPRLHPPGESYSLSSAGWERRNEIEKERDAQIRQTLGEARHADFLRAIDQEYQQLNQLARRESLPAASVADTYRLRETVLEQAAHIASDAALDDAQKRASLQLLGQGARAQINASLGPNAGPIYARVADRWLTALEAGKAVTKVGNAIETRNIGAPPPPRPPP